MDIDTESSSHTETTASDDEIALLQSMYPDDVTYDSKASQLTFKHGEGKLVLRLPDKYPTESLPDIISATGRGVDIRSIAKGIIESQSPGEAYLDAVITDFIEFLGSQELHQETFVAKDEFSSQRRAVGQKTTIIWLHHLLATGKRKLAIGPQASQISGVTKPGYPGVMIFSGSTDVVEEHVNLLRQQRWQAFQVRYEEDKAWSFRHGQGIIELETMGDVVADIEGTGHQKDAFMQAMKIK